METIYTNGAHVVQQVASAADVAYFDFSGQQQDGMRSGALPFGFVVSRGGRPLRHSFDRSDAIAQADALQINHAPEAL